MSAQKKVISIGDYAKKHDRVRQVDVGEYFVPFRIKSPTPNESLDMLELMNKAIEEGIITEQGDDETTTDDLMSMTAEQRISRATISFIYQATTISSCTFYPPDIPEGESLPDILPPNPEKVWADADAVMNGCDMVLFKSLFNMIQGEKVAEQLSKEELSK